MEFKLFVDFYKAFRSKPMTTRSSSGGGMSLANNASKTVPVSVYPHMHWLAIEGVQPQVIENEVIEKKMVRDKSNTSTIKLKTGKRRKSILH